MEPIKSYLETGCLTATFVGRVPTFRKLDKTASEDVAVKYGVASNTGRYWKYALQCDELDKVRAITAAMRIKFYEKTSSWGREGVRILPTEMYTGTLKREGYCDIFRNDYYLWKDAVNKFIAAYPALLLEAPNQLRGMYNPNDYPDISTIRDKFEVSLHVGPMPTVGDFRIEMAEEQLQDLKDKLTKQLETAQRESLKDLWNRLYERVEAMALAFNDPEKRFHDSMIEHTKTLCEDLEIMNFTKDPKLETMRWEVLTKLGALNPDKVRISTDSTGPRATAGRTAADILKRIEQFRSV